MSKSIRHRGGGLGAFVRAGSEGETRHGTRRSSPEKRPDTPQINDPVPTRQEMAQMARISVPKANDDYASDPRQDGNTGSDTKQVKIWPQHGRRKSAKSPEPYGGLFSGSQLGDDFMNSSLSTPQKEYDDFRHVNDERVAGVEGDEELQQQGYRHYGRSTQKRDQAAFQIGANGQMSVVTRGPRHDLSQMKDGFQRGTTDYPTPSEHLDFDFGGTPSPAERGPKNPVPPRESERRQPWDIETHTRHLPSREPSPTLESTHWRNEHRQRKETRGQKPRRQMEADGFDSVSAHEEQQETPKAKRRPDREAEQPPGVIPHSKQPDTKKRRHIALDYDDQILSTMSYDELQDQPFDFDPAKDVASNGTLPTTVDLASRLQHYSARGADEQRRMFGAMSIDEWEDSGDWFVEQFAGIMRQMKEARRNKRRVIHGMEQEVSVREDTVRHVTDAIDRKLSDMKQNGMRVVGGNH